MPFLLATASRVQTNDGIATRAEIFACEIPRPPFPPLPPPFANDDEEELIDLDAANVDAAAGPALPTWASALWAVFDPANRPLPAAAVYLDLVGGETPFEVYTTVYRGPGRLGVVVLASGEDHAVFIMATEEWPVATNQ